MIVSELLLFAILGAFTGTASGLLGIGGGILIIPFLSMILIYFGMPVEYVIHIAVSTSLCIMIFTSLSSVIAHSRKGNVVWSAFKYMIPFIIVGVALGIIISKHINAHLLTVLFGIFLLSVSFKMFKGFKHKTAKKGKVSSKKRKLARPVAFIIGFKSGVLGVGGGTLSVPFFFYYGFKASKAIGTSASFTFPIAVIGTIVSFFVHSGGSSNLPYTYADIYIPALVVIAPLSMIFVNLGVKLVKILPDKTVRIIFACLLVFLGISMITG